MAPNERGHYPILMEVELGAWEGALLNQPWLRWWDLQGNLLLTGTERWWQSSSVGRATSRVCREAARLGRAVTRNGNWTQICSLVGDLVLLEFQVVGDILEQLIDS